MTAGDMERRDRECWIRFKLKEVTKAQADKVYDEVRSGECEWVLSDGYGLEPLQVQPILTIEEQRERDRRRSEERRYHGD